MFGWIYWFSYYSCQKMQCKIKILFHFIPIHLFADELYGNCGIQTAWRKLRRKPVLWSLFPCRDIPDLMRHLQFNYLDLKYAAWLTLQDVIQYKFCWFNSPNQPALDLEWVVNYVFVSPPPTPRASSEFCQYVGFPLSLGFCLTLHTYFVPVPFYPVKQWRWAIWKRWIKVL